MVGKRHLSPEAGLPVRRGRLAGRRPIKVDVSDLEVLKRHRAAQDFERRSWADAYRAHGLILCRPDGTPHHPDMISGEFERLVKLAGVKRIRFHDMCHTHATLLLEAGVDITVVSKRLGHASVKATADLYVQVTERLQEAAAERFCAYLPGQLPESASNRPFRGRRGGRIAPDLSSILAPE
jgi:integrase